MIKITRPVCPNPEALKKNYKHPENKEALRQSSSDKCMYCECKVSHSYHGDIEHIKPKSKFTDLEFDWNNLGYVCAVCNGIKGNKYNDKSPILNPYDEDPEIHIVALGAVVACRNDSERGQITIEKENGVHLNRPALIERRQDRLNLIKRIIDVCSGLEANAKEAVLENLKVEADADKEYSLCVKELLKLEGVN
ncbi:MAG: HNH endonuclease [Candidatus Gracilibacteria bacterium]|jgi:CRISPR/Cas system Type II protein with McrA/HNH and RuvC-like nuclease domain